MFENLNPTAKKALIGAAVLIPVVIIVLVLSRSPSQEEAVEATAFAVDLDAGKQIAMSACESCHSGSSSAGSEDVPHINGQHADYIMASLAAHQKGDRTSEKMGTVAVDLDEAAMRNVAAYYSSLPVFSENRTGAIEGAKSMDLDEDPFVEIRTLAAPCAGCHGEVGNINIPSMPALAGQHMPYLITSLKAYRDGLRPGMMQSFVASMTDRQIEDLSYFYASQEPLRQETPLGADPYAGVAVAQACAICHGDDGNIDNQDTPRLAGIDAAYLVAAIRSYKTGERRHSSMEDAVTTLTEVDIENVSAYYAMAEPEPAAVRRPLTTAQWAEKCDRCHGTDGNSVDPTVPILAGQSETYLSNALKGYHLGKHGSSVMYAMTFQMTESDIDKLAAYYSSRVRE
jgi:cytochrome c553